VISPAVALSREDGNFHADPPPAGSVTELVAEVTPADAPVAGAYHTLPAGPLADLDRDLEMDVPIAGDPAAVRTVVSLTEAVAGLRPLRAGGVGNAPELEALTPLLLNLGRHDERAEESGVRFG
jgi:predicted dinucleotide-binding enzyme